MKERSIKVYTDDRAKNVRERVAAALDASYVALNECTVVVGRGVDIAVYDYHLDEETAEQVLDVMKK